MVRPRVGDFLYSDEELGVMLEDIGLFKSLGIAGVVFGVLDRDGTVDVPHTQMYVLDLFIYHASPSWMMVGSWRRHFLCKVGGNVSKIVQCSTKLC